MRTTVSAMALLLALGTGAMAQVKNNDMTGGANNYSLSDTGAAAQTWQAPVQRILGSTTMRTVPASPYGTTTQPQVDQQQSQQSYNNAVAAANQQAAQQAAAWQAYQAQLAAEAAAAAAAAAAAQQAAAQQAAQQQQQDPGPVYQDPGGGAPAPQPVGWWQSTCDQNSCYCAMAPYQQVYNCVFTFTCVGGVCQTPDPSGWHSIDCGSWGNPSPNNLCLGMTGK